jgi:hypothetical protein
MALVMLAACAKKAPPAHHDEEEEAPAALAAPSPAQNQPAPTINLGESAAGMLTLIDTAPQCQKFRDQLETVARSPQGAAPLDGMAKIVASAHEAGCGRKTTKP